jgi:replicative DNA helicase
MTATTTLLPKLILQKLVTNEEYMRKCIPHLKQEYFEEESFQILFSTINNFITLHNNLPAKKALLIELSKNDSLQNHQQLAQETVETVSEIYSFDDSEYPLDWLLVNTEKWCQERAIYNSIVSSINILDGKDQTKTKHAIPELLQEALSVTFNTNVGHDYLENFQERFDFYHSASEKIPFDIELLNIITGGGVETKSLNALLAPTGAGKSLILCHFAAAYLMQSKNVLYITMEMSDKKIAQRIDANLMNLSINEFKTVSETIFNDRMETIIAKTKGKFIVKEYPTASAHSGHFRALLNELRTKKNFIPDIILIDYLNICASSRVKFTGNTYTYVKFIAEELRGLAVEFDVPIWTATQTNRQGIDSSDFGMGETSDSIGLPYTLDLYLGIIATEELIQRGQYLFKQLKNRYNDLNYYNKFYVGVSRSKMKLYNLEQSAAVDASSPSDGEKQNHTDDLMDFSSFKKDELVDFSGFRFE